MGGPTLWRWASYVSMPTVEEHWASLKRHDRWTVQSHVVAALASHCAQLCVPQTSSELCVDVRMLDAAASERSSGGATVASSIRSNDALSTRSSSGAASAWTELVVAEDALLRRKRSLTQQPWHEELLELPRTAKRQCWAEELADAEHAMRECHVSAPDRVPRAVMGRDQRAAWVTRERPPMPMSGGYGRGRGGVLLARGRAPHLSRLRGGARGGRGFGRSANDMSGG